MIIRGNKGGGGSAPPFNQNTIFSREQKDILILTHGHSIKGLVEGEKSVFIDDVPLISQDDQANFENYSLQYKTGHMDDVPFTDLGGQEKTIEASRVEIKKATQKVVQITSELTDTVYIGLSMQLFDSIKGGREKAKIGYMISVQEFGGSELTKVTKTFNEIVDQEYRIPEYGINIRGLKRPVTIKITKTSADSTDSRLVSNLYFVKASESIEKNFTWDGCSIARIRATARGNDSVSSISFLVNQCDQIKVPSNYNEKTGKYDGVWNGSFKIGSYNNVLYAMRWWLMDKRNGLGLQFEYGNLNVDDQELYRISRYWDEKVDNGYGVLEPRSSFNYYSQNDENSTANQIAYFTQAVNGGWYEWNGTFHVWSDIPTEPIGIIISNADVMDFEFNYEEVGIDEIKTSADVHYNEPKNNYKIVPVSWSEPQLVQKYGERKMSLQFIGCTSRAQALRKAKAVVAEYLFEKETVRFTIPSHRFMFRLGEVIQISDQHRHDMAINGIVIDYDPVSKIINAGYEIEWPENSKGWAYTINAKDLPYKGKCSVNGPFITIDQDIPIEQGGTFIVYPDDKFHNPTTWRVTTYQPSDDGMYISLACKEYNPLKYSYINENVSFDDLNEFLPQIKPLEAPKNLRMIEATSETTLDSSIDIFVSWEQVSGAETYTLQWTKDDQASPVTAVIVSTNYKINTMGPGKITVKVNANGYGGRVGPSSLSELDALGNFAQPADVSGLKLIGSFTANGFSVQWDKTPRAATYNVKISTVDGSNYTNRRKVNVGNNLSFSYSKEDMLNDKAYFRTLSIEVHGVGISGETSKNWAVLTISKPAPSVPSAIKISTNIPKSIRVDCDLGRDKDPSIEGMVVYASLMSGFSPSASNRIWSGDQPSHMWPADAGKPVYVKIAAYDGFGLDWLNYSSELTGTPITAASSIEENGIDLSQLNNVQFFSSIAVMTERLATSGFVDNFPSGHRFGGWNGRWQQLKSSNTVARNDIYNTNRYLQISSHDKYLYAINEKTFKVNPGDEFILNFSDYFSTKEPGYFIVPIEDQTKNFRLVKKSDGVYSGISPFYFDRACLYVYRSEGDLIPGNSNGEMPEKFDYIVFSKSSLSVKGEAVTILTPNSITSNEMGANSVLANNIYTTNLAAINADMGNITAGSILSADGTRYLNMDGSRPNMIHSNNFKVDHQGNVTANNASFTNCNVSGIVKASQFVSLDGNGVVDTSSLRPNSVTISSTKDFTATFPGSSGTGPSYFDVTSIANLSEMFPGCYWVQIVFVGKNPGVQNNYLYASTANGYAEQADLGNWIWRWHISGDPARVSLGVGANKPLASYPTVTLSYRITGIGFKR